MKAETHIWLVCGPSQTSARFYRDSTSARSQPRGTQREPTQASGKPRSSVVGNDGPQPPPRGSQEVGR
jgi:hypothetical protein